MSNALMERIHWLETRLECYARDASGALVSVPDGIACRDETIKLLEARLDEGKKRLDGLVASLERIEEEAHFSLTIAKQVRK